MQTIHVKHDKNVEGLHHFGERVDRIVHDERFWPAVIAIALLGTFIGLVVWAGIYGQANPDVPPYPFTPYIY